MDNIKTVIIHGQNHKGSTYHIAHELAKKISDIKKKVLPIILSLSLGLSLAACGKNNNTDDEKGTAEIKIHQCCALNYLALYSISIYSSFRLYFFPDPQGQGSFRPTLTTRLSPYCPTVAKESMEL